MNFKKLTELHHFQTGDIVLFSYGGNSCLDNLIKAFTRSTLTHVGMIIHNPSWRPELQGYYLLQSTRDVGLNDAEDNENKFGVQLTKLEDALNYNGKIYWRHIIVERNEEFYKKLSEAHSKVHNRPYDTNLVDWIKAGLKIDVGDTHKLKTFWCSALVTFILVELNLLDKETEWTLISPADLSSKSETLKFLNCTVSQDILINH
jgi:hypothetical protein